LDSSYAKLRTLLSFLHMTERAGDVRQTGQPVMDEPIGRKG
jgi:hypothetical protein